MFSWIAQGFENIITIFTSLIEKLESFFTNLDLNLGGWFENIGLWFGELKDNITSLFNDMLNNLANLFSNLEINLSDWFGNVGTWFSNLSTNLGSWFSNLGNSIGEFFSNLWVNVTDFFAGIPEFFSDFWNALTNAFKSLFIPKQESYNGIKDIIREKFGIIDELNKYVEELKIRLEGLNSSSSSSESKSVNYPKFEFAVDTSIYSGNLVVFDLAWISPYISSIHSFLTAFIYIFFFWRLYVKLPSIFSGASGLFEGKGDK